jgi:hypothetical protein
MGGFPRPYWSHAPIILNRFKQHLFFAPGSSSPVSCVLAPGS